MSVSASRTVSTLPSSTSLRRSSRSIVGTYTVSPGMEEILRKLAAELGPVESEPQALEDGITNRNFRVRFGGTEHVVRMCGKETELLGIDREAEREAAEIAHRAGLGPAVSSFLVDDNCLVT